MVPMTVKTLANMVFKPAARYPADPRAVFILALSVFSGITSLAIEQAPETLQSVLPYWVVVAWGVLLTVGSAITLAGMARQTVNGIVTEQIGSVTVAATTIFYSGIAFWQIGASAIQAVGIILAWGLSCGIRWFQLQALINNAAAREAKIVRLARLDAELRARIEGELSRKRFRADEHDDLGKWGTQ